jgi:pimeloyl-ACP methyl ester carboxylesterase
MQISPGFEPKSAVTTLGSMTYVEPQPGFWGVDRPQPTAPLVFFHGFGGGSSSYEWSKVYPAFAPHYRVLAADLVGWGHSDHPARAYTLADYVDSLEAFLESTCPPNAGAQAATVVASSLTGAMLVRLAVARPKLFRQLILVAPTGLADFGKPVSSEVLAQILRLPLIDKALYWGAIATPDAIRSFLKNRQFANAELISAEIVSAYLASARQPNAEYAALAFVRGDLSFDLALDLPQLKVPTFVIWGDQAQFTSVVTGQQLAALNPDFVRRFDVLPATGLTPQLEFPAVTIGLIKQYLAALS